MHKLKVLICYSLISTFLFTGCANIDLSKEDKDPEAFDDENFDDEAFENLEEDNMSESASDASVEDETIANTDEDTDETENDSEELSEEADQLGEMKYLDLSATYDPEDEESFLNGIRTVVNSDQEEEEFLSFFVPDNTELEMVEDSSIRVFLGTNDNECIFAAFISYSDISSFSYDDIDEEYPKMAYACRYKVDDATLEATFDASVKGDEVFDAIYDPSGDGEYELINCLKPLLDYQEKTYIENDEGQVVKVEYTSDQYEYGTYNSSGEVFLDEKGRPLFRDYYVTSGSRFSYYLYNEDDELVQIFDFGGMAYKGLDSNPDIEIGILFDIYLFER